MIKDDKELDNIRHTLAHVLAGAMLKKFPKAKFRSASSTSLKNLGKFLRAENCSFNFLRSVLPFMII